MKGLLAIPAHNEADCIGALLDEAAEYWPRTDTLVINDGSKDRTREIVDKKQVTQLVHPTNLGYDVAVQTAFRYGAKHGYDYAVLMDADGQHDPKHLPLLVKRFQETGADLVIGSRFLPGQTMQLPLARRLGMWTFRQLTRFLIRKKIQDTSSGFKAVHARLFSEMTTVPFVDFHAELLVYLSVRGYEVEEVPVGMRNRSAGKSMHSWTSIFHYPPRTVLGILIGLAEARARRNEPLPERKDRHEVSRNPLRTDSGLVGIGRDRPAD